MGESIPFGDLIVLGAIALFIILRYRSVLGQKTGFDVSKSPRPEKETVVLAPPQKKTPEPEAEEAPEFDNPELAAAIARIREADPAFSVPEFISGAKIAFEMVIDAFNQHDRETLKMLLAPSVYESFEESLKEQEDKKWRMETTLVALKSAEIIQAELKKQHAQITVQFLSEQVQVTRDKNKAIVEGDATRMQDIADEWVFERDVRSRNPNWLVIAT